MGAWLTTREAVADALDINTTANAATQIDRAIESASRQIEQYLRRRIVPELDTKYFEWPPRAGGEPYWKVRLGYNELISATTVTAGGTTMSGYYLEPDGSGPPYTRLEMPRTGTGFEYGDTPQRNIAVTGLFGYRNDTVSIGTLSSSITDSATTHSAGTGLSFATGIGVGSILLIGSERMDVTAKAYATTGYTITADLAASMSATTVAMSAVTGLIAGGYIKLGSETMLITSKTGSNLTVKRAVDGSVLAAHTSGAAVSAPRSLTLRRAQYGTTAATHAISAAVTRWVPPGPIESLCIAEAILLLENERAGWARTVGSGETETEARGTGVQALRKLVYREYGRRHRMVAV